MTPPTLEWIDKAEGDYRAMQQLHDASAPVFEAIGFHAQQCVEKYMKALLQSAGISFPRTHDLEALLEVLANEKELQARGEDIALLSRFAVDVRYPGVVPDEDEVQEAVQICTDLRTVIRHRLRLE